jgi:hypothetical protein
LEEIAMAFKIGNLVLIPAVDLPDFDIFSSDPDGGLPPGGVPPSPPPGPNEFTLDPFRDLARIRLYLQVALTHLGGPLTAEELQPRSITEIEELEGHLATALEQVRAMRDRFG